MSITHQWYDKQRLVIITLRDVMKGQEVLEAYSSLCLDDRYYSTYHQFWDCRKMSGLNVGLQDMKAIKLMVDIYCPSEESAIKRRVAILAPQYPIYAATHAFLSISGKCSKQRKVFRTFPAAKAWIGGVLSNTS